MKITSTFALLDVRKGRNKLFRKLGYTGTGERIPVTLRGYITYAWGDDDGTSREFAVDVTEVETGEPK